MCHTMKEKIVFTKMRWESIKTPSVAVLDPNDNTLEFLPFD